MTKTYLVKYCTSPHGNYFLVNKTFRSFYTANAHAEKMMKKGMFVASVTTLGQIQGRFL